MEKCLIYFKSLQIGLLSIKYNATWQQIFHILFVFKVLIILLY